MSPGELLEFSNTLIAQGHKIEEYLLETALRSNGAASFRDLLLMTQNQTISLRREIDEYTKKRMP